MTAKSSARRTEGAGAAAAITRSGDQLPIPALQPDPVDPPPIGAEEMAAVLRATGIELGTRLAVVAATMRMGLLQCATRFRARERPPEPYATIGGSNRLLHTPDYTTVTWCGEEYHLTPLQAQAVRVLHHWQRQGIRELRGSVILKEIDAYSRSLSDIFKRSPAWNRLVLPGGRRGFYQLVS